MAKQKNRNPVVEILRALTEDDVQEQVERAESRLRDSVEKLKAAKLSKDESCFIAHVYKSTRGDSFSEFMAHLAHLADKHDCLPAARAVEAVGEFLQLAAVHLKGSDDKYGTTFNDPEDIPNATESHKQAQEVLERIQRQNDLQKSLS